MLREYELTVITKADLPDTESAKVLGRYEALMTKDGGQILRRDDWGTKRLAYNIKKQFRGHYLNYDFAGTSENLAEMERLMRFDENVLRFLSIRLNEAIDIDARKAEIAKERANMAAAERRAAEQDRDDDGERVGGGRGRDRDRED